MQIAIFEILNLGLLEYFRSRVASGGSNPACLGELGGNLLPLFSYKKAKGDYSKDPWSPWLCISAVFGEKNCFREENPSWGASITLPRRFREQICVGFPSFFIRSSFVLRSSTGKFSNPRLSIHFLFRWLSSLFRSLSVFFSSVFNKL